MVENNKYFTSFCSVLDDGECKDMMQKVESGEMTNEDVYQKLIEKHGDDKITNAHLHAAKAMERVDTVQPAPVTAPPPPIPPVGKTDMAVKIKTLQEEKADVKPSLLNENKMPNPPSAIDNLCRVCATPLVISTLEVLSQWYSGKDKEKIREIEDRLEAETISLEDAFVEVFSDIKGSIDGVSRTLGDFNKVLELALIKTREKNPALQGKIDMELQEMHEGEGEED